MEKVLTSGSDAQVWHLNVHYSRSLTDLEAFSPVLLSAGGVPRAQHLWRLYSWWAGRGPAPAPRQPLGRRWAGRAQGVAGGGGGPFCHEFRRGTLISPASREFAPRCEPHPARAKCGLMIRMRSGSRLAFQRLSRDTLKSILGVKVGGNVFPGRTL
eukprot:gene13614-biopygen11085